MGLPTSHSKRFPLLKPQLGFKQLLLLSAIILSSFLIKIDKSEFALQTFDGLASMTESLWLYRGTNGTPEERAKALLARFPIIDGHIDLPILARAVYLNQVDDFDMNVVNGTKGQVDIPRLKKGRVGGFFWSVFVECPGDTGVVEDKTNFTVASFRVRDTLEQIDIAQLIVAKYSKVFQLVTTANQWRRSMRAGKIVGMLGVEGGHQLGSSLSPLRIYYQLGARYVTLTHTCHNALGDSCGAWGSDIGARWNGLSSFGRLAIREMNRLGLMVDLSHTSPKTASDSLSLSLAPPIFSHSNARGIHPAVRNIPDTILRRIGQLSKRSHQNYSLSDDGEGGIGWGADTNETRLAIPSGDTIIMLNFSPDFISEFPPSSNSTSRRATLSLLVDHADYIGKLAGKEFIGIGSDFDGIASTPEGLSDVSFYPDLVAEFFSRGWNEREISGVTTNNLLRILEKTEKVAKELQRQGQPAENGIFEGRTDMVHKWF